MHAHIRARRLAAIASIAAAALTGAASAPAASAADGLAIRVLSNRADLISDGQALVAVRLPNGVSASQIEMQLDGRDVTRHFRVRPDGRYAGLVHGLRNGPNVLVAIAPGGLSARVKITNHPNGGPVFAGPQPQPWTCQEGALDRKCNQAPIYEYFYESTNLLNKGFQPYDPAHPPSDVATTTTDEGVTVPFIVRQETGYQDRDQYRIATLFQPGKQWTSFKPQPQFNHKLLITHGASCGVSYAVGGAPSVTTYNPADLLGLPVDLPVIADSADFALGRGFAVMSTALDNNGHNCNLVTQAESLIMAKEHLIERYGTLRYTIGTGCSGGSLTQQWVANAYPGIYQGILPTCSFPDTWSSATQVMDYHLLRAYLEDVPARLANLWTPLQWGAVEGNLLPIDAILSDIGFFSAIEATYPCDGTTDKTRYQAKKNPGGVRCSIADLAINVFGPRSPDVWSPAEKALGRGFAGVPVDNVGVQYGLDALKTLQITPGQFVDLNTRIGGLNVDAQPIPQRIRANQPALEYAYRSGSINEANNLGQTAMIDCRGPDPGAAHDSYRAFAVRARLDRENGTHANQLIWEGPAPIVGDSQCAQASFAAMDRWLAAVEKDESSKALPRKIIDDKPGDLTDMCFSGVGIKLTNSLCPPGIVPVYGTPRTVAGDAITTDANKCQLKPLRRTDYPPLVHFTDAQWTKLQQTFPRGVCDFSKPGVSQGATIPWLTYQHADGSVIYGGHRIDRAPSGSGLGWAAPAFRSWLRGSG